MKRSNRIIVVLLALTVSLGTFWACKRTMSNDEVLGNTSLKSAPSDFSGITNTPGILAKVGSNKKPSPIGYPKLLSSVPASGNNFGGASRLEYIYFDNTLSHEVTWYVTFKGQISGAVKKFTGTGKSIVNGDFAFNTSPDGNRYFVRNEMVDFTLTFLGSAISYTGSLKIFDADYGPIKYDGTGADRILDNGDTMKYYKIDNFDMAGGIQTSYSDAADGAGKAVFYVTDKTSVNDYLSFYMKGTDNNGNNYCGGSSDEALTAFAGTIKETDPTKVFVNAYIYGYGRPNSALFFQVFENDFADPSTPPSNWPVRNKALNDMWYTIVNVDWTGWKLVSIPYSSFKPASDPKAGGGGNRIKQPQLISGFGIELESYPTPGQTVELGLDMVTITTNAPFQP